MLFKNVGDFYCAYLLYSTTSIHIYPIPLQLFPSHINLPHQLLMRPWYIIEGEDAPSQLEKKVGAEGDESPEGKLLEVLSETFGAEGKRERGSVRQV